MAVSATKGARRCLTDAIGQAAAPLQGVLPRRVVVQAVVYAGGAAQQQ